MKPPEFKQDQKLQYQIQTADPYQNGVAIIGQELLNRRRVKSKESSKNDF